MPKRLTSETVQEWRLLTIQDLHGKGTQSTIDNELKRKLQLLGFAKRAIDKQIGAGWNRSALVSEKLVTNKGGQWQLTASGEARAKELRRNKKRDITDIARGKARDKQRVVGDLARESGIASGKIRLLQRYGDIPVARLKALLEEWRQGNPESPHDVDGNGGGSAECLPDGGYKERMEVEAVAIKRIRQEESEWHTTPTNNPGYDLYLTHNNEKNGNKVAWCEVKAISGTFDTWHAVSLTSREFQEAQKRGDAYWLYIVENVDVKNVDSSDTHIIRIPNPAGKVERFRFGQSWRDHSTQ